MIKVFAARFLRYDMIVFGITSLIQKTTALRKGLLRMTAAEQESRKWRPRMSDVLWDTYTGGAPHKDVFLRSLHPDTSRNVDGSIDPHADSKYGLSGLLRCDGARKPGGEQWPLHSLRGTWENIPACG